MVNDPAYPDENLAKSLTEVNGIIRKGEEESWLCKKRNWIDDGVFGSIDLKYMTRVHRLHNYNQSTIAYIERVVPELTEDEKTTYPVPTDKDSVKLANSGLSGRSISMIAAGVVGWAALWVI